MKIKVTINNETNTYLCEDWSLGEDMVVIHTKPTILLIDGKETKFTSAPKTVYINKRNLDCIEVEEDA